MFDDHFYYDHNRICKPYSVGIVKYAEIVQDIFEFSLFFSHTYNKLEEFTYSFWVKLDTPLNE